MSDARRAGSGARTTWGLSPFSRSESGTVPLRDAEVISRLVPSTLRRGITLVELLVVIGITLMLVAVAVPAMRPAMEGRRIREAARAVNVFFSAARNDAMARGLPVGVIIERLERQPQAAVILRQAEVPPPYAGDLIGAVVQAESWTYTNDTSWGAYPFYRPTAERILKLRIRDADFSSGLIRRGDLVQLNRQGPWYEIGYDDNASLPADFGGLQLPDFPLDAAGYIDFNPPGKTLDPTTGTWIISHELTLTLDRSSGYHSPYPQRRYNTPPPLVWSMPVAFQILRQPMPSAVQPVQLAQRAVIDLAYSGADSLPGAFAPSGPNDDRPVIVMFSPNGSVDGVYFRHPMYGYGKYPTSEALYFLVGVWERVPPTVGGASDTDDRLLNWQDANNLWVALNSQTGLVTVAELHADRLNQATKTYMPSSIKEARKYAREAQISKGGR